MKTKLNELLEFPTPFTYKVMGLAKPELVDQVVEVVQRHAPGDYSPSVKPSSKGNYHSVSITITATHIEQVETLYEELGNIEIVRMVLSSSRLPGLPGNPFSPCDILPATLFLSFSEMLFCIRIKFLSAIWGYSPMNQSPLLCTNSLIPAMKTPWMKSG